MTLRAWATVNIAANMNFEFEWSILERDIQMKVVVVFDYAFSAGLTAEFVGQVIALIEDLVEWSKWKVLYIGPVPVQYNFIIYFA